MFTTSYDNRDAPNDFSAYKLTLCTKAAYKIIRENADDYMSDTTNSWAVAMLASENALWESSRALRCSLKDHTNEKRTYSAFGDSMQME